VLCRINASDIMSIASSNYDAMQIKQEQPNYVSG
jgi:hypothetical protein